MTTQPETPYSEEAARELLDRLDRLGQLSEYRRQLVCDVLARAVDIGERSAVRDTGGDPDRPAEAKQ